MTWRMKHGKPFERPCAFFRPFPPFTTTPDRLRMSRYGLPALPTPCRAQSLPVRCALSMKDVTSGNFGLVIAYLLPGFTALWGLSYLSEPVRAWLGNGSANTPTVGGFLYVTLASVALGLLASTVRWIVIDTIHHHTGVPRPHWDFSRLQQNVAAFDVLGENHYRYYQFYSNMAVAIPFWYIAKCLADGFWPPPFGWASLGISLVEAVLLAGSRDTAWKYFTRMAQVLDVVGSAGTKDLRCRRSSSAPAPPSRRPPDR